MNNLKNKNKIFFKKFLCSTFITLFLILNGVNILSFASAEPPPQDPSDKTFTHSITINKWGTINPPNTFWNRLGFWLFDEFLSPVTSIILCPFRRCIGRGPESLRRIKSLESRMSHMINQTYPVGSIYMSVNEEDPENFLGGIWERWGAGRVPVGVNTTQSEFSSVEQTGGSRTHTHTLDSAAAMVGSDWGRPETLAFSARNVGNLGATTYVLETHNRDPDTRGRSHNTALTGTTDTSANLQPYITCYMWKRIA